MIILNDIGIKTIFKLLTKILTVHVKIFDFDFSVAMNNYIILSLIWIVLNIFSIIWMLYNFDTPSCINHC